MIRILHAADLHLDSPFEGLPEEKAALRRNEQRQLLRALAQLRAESGAQLVLLAGDLFDSAASWAGTEDTLRLALAEMEVPVFISPGNHDFYSRSGRWQRLSSAGRVATRWTPESKAPRMSSSPILCAAQRPR